MAGSGLIGIKEKICTKNCIIIYGIQKNCSTLLPISLQRTFPHVNRENPATQQAVSAPCQHGGNLDASMKEILMLAWNDPQS
jgi:hypothetical protein